MIVLGIGSVLVWIGFLIQSSSFIQVIKYSYTGFIVLACGGVLIFIAFIGIVGAWKRSRFFLTLFVISSVIIGILLIAFGGVLIYLRDLSYSYLEDEESCRDHFEKSDDTSIRASNVFCKLYCPCDLEKSTADDLKIDQFYKGSAISVKNCNPCESIQTYEPHVQQELILWLDEELGIKVNVTECAITSDEFKDTYFKKYDKYITFITWIEKKFSCSGLCTAQKVRFFSDVTEDLPKESCYKDLRDWSRQMFLSYGIVSCILGVYQLAIIYFSLSLCLCPRRKIDLPPEMLSSPSKAFKG
jgi:hypothetical protein